MSSIRPGIHPNIDLDYANFGWKEKEIVRILALRWRITFARFQVFKDSAFSFVFAHPTDELKEKYRLEKEVLVLLSRYPEFDTRAFDFVDKIMSEYQNRLDKLCIIVISQDQKIAEKIKTLVASDPQERLIIPYSYSDFSSLYSDAIVSQRLHDFFYGRDLFAFESPLKSDLYFFGRKEIVQFLYDKYKAGENSGLFGLRKIGKTSVLFALKRYLNLREEFCVFFDCQDPSFHKRRWFEVLEFIIREAISSLERELGKDFDISIGSYDEKSASKLFRDDLIRLYEFCGKKRILLVFDEIENISFDVALTGHWKDGEDFILFWQSIRSAFQQSTEIFSFIIGGVNPYIIEHGHVKAFDNPIYRMVSPQFLPLFDLKATKEMISSIGKYMGLDFEEEIFTFLKEEYGGHPFLIRQVCSRMHSIFDNPRPAVITKLFFKQHKALLDQAIVGYVESIVCVLNQWYPEEYELLEFLAAGERERFKKEISGKKLIIQHLLGYSLIQGNEGEYFINIKAVENFLRERCSVLKRSLSTENRREEIFKKRDQLEVNLRKVIKMVIKVSYGSETGRRKFLEIIPSERIEKVGAATLEEILNGKAIYFSDLKEFILKDWENFDKVFQDKGIFETCMFVINKYRVDAHAKDVADGEFKMVILALEEMQKKVDEFLA